MANMRNFLQPDFQASTEPQMQWMPWEENGDQANMGNIVDQLKKFQQPSGGMMKGGQMSGTEGKGMTGGTAGKGASSL